MQLFKFWDYFLISAPYCTCGRLLSAYETGVSGQLGPQRCGGYFRNRRDLLWSGLHHGTPARNRCLCYWRCLASLESLQVTQGGSCPVLARCFSAGCEMLPKLIGSSLKGLLWLHQKRNQITSVHNISDILQKQFPATRIFDSNTTQLYSECHQQTWFLAATPILYE